MGNVLLAPLAVVLGYSMLWAVRHQLGAAGSALASLPLGILGFSLIATLHSIAGSPWSALSFTVGAVLVAAVCWAALRATAGCGSDTRNPAWTMLVPLAAATGASAIAERYGAYFVTPDSWANYLTMGMRLFDSGALFERLMQERSLLIPAMNAAGRVVGADVLWAIYPVMGLWVLALVYRAVYRHSAQIPPGWRIVVAAASATGVAGSGMFLIQSLYIHSHMASALFLLFALVSFAQAESGESAAWSAMGGLATAGFTLARPDGFAYAAAVMLVGIVAVGRSDGWRRQLAGALGGFWIPIGLFYGTAYAQLGVWVTPKLNGRLAAAMLAVHAVLAIAAWLALSRLGTRRKALLRQAPTLMVAAATATIALAVAVRTDTFMAALEPMTLNLFAEGGHGAQWYVAAIVLALLLLLPQLRKRTGTAWVGMVGLVLFFDVAVLVHGLTHPGRLSWADSFNRIAFHAAPLLWWAFGALATAALAVLRAPKSRAS